MSKIEWTEETWNPIAGCSKVSTGCRNCYAIKMSHRLAHNPKMGDRYKGLTTKRINGETDFTGEVRLNEEVLLQPLKKKKPTMYFVNSMSDLFHENVPFHWIDKVFAVMALCPQHTFQTLTKRAKRMKEYFEYKRTFSNILLQAQLIEENLDLEDYENSYNFYQSNFPHEPLKNVWLGVSAENHTQANKRIPYLLATPAAVRFVSAEPLLDNIDFEGIYDTEADLVIDALKGEKFFFPDKSDMLEYCGDTNKLDWIIVGGKSGHGARIMHEEWVRSIRDQCKGAKVPFFFKQWGAYLPVDRRRLYDSKIKRVEFTDGSSYLKVGKKQAGNLLEGNQYLQMPNHYETNTD